MAVRQRPSFIVEMRIDSSMTTAGHNHRGGEPRKFSIAEGAVVLTLTISAVGELPPGVAEAGEIEQLAPAGAPLQVNETDWLNPPKAVMLREY
jgi:hypothetical protein